MKNRAEKSPRNLYYRSGAGGLLSVLFQALRLFLSLGLKGLRHEFLILDSISGLIN
jgi:hypothetical protein